MVRRDFISRYKGSLLGALWPVLNPLGHMILYTFLFAIILKVRFTPGSGTANFALYLMAGLLPWTAMSEALASAPTKILESPNLVKKVVFPLEILPFILVLASFINGVISVSLLLIFVAVIMHGVHITFLFMPLILFSHFLFTAGLAWFLASIGVFVRDARHIVALGLAAWLYGTPIIYPASSLPEKLKIILWLNPVAGMVSDYRRVLLEGLPPDWSFYCLYTTISVVMFFGGLYFFSKTKKTFADVL
ncbi:MAG: ABC transporter permease [Candidatus Melainabacteria bacterium]|nr:ABC transporter permease [Candidatus Melainabacteria bacterium]